MLGSDQIVHVGGYPTTETTALLLDELRFQAAVQVYLWSLPLMNVISIRNGHQGAGVGNATIGVFEQFLTPAQVVPTGNQETVYAFGVLVCEKPMVFDVPKGTLGFVADGWERPIQDVGLTGPDEGAGGRYLIVPPGFEGEVPESGYYVARSDTVNVFWLLRGFVGKDGDPAPAAESLKQAGLYPLSEADAPPEQEYVNLSEVPYHGITPRSFVYWEWLAAALQEEPVLERDRVMMGMADAIGITKDAPFDPSPEMRAILTHALEVGRAMAEALAFGGTNPEARVYEDREWERVFVTKSPVFETGSHLELYERSAFMAQAMTGARSMVTPMIGAGSQYHTTFRDSTGGYLNGDNSYRLHVPANVPVNNFWSVAVYDTTTYSLIANETDNSTLHSNMMLDENDDGSVDINLGPTPPDSGETNWVKTNRGKGFFLYFRYYGPTQEFFNKTWRPGDVERLQ